MREIYRCGRIPGYLNVQYVSTCLHQMRLRHKSTSPNDRNKPFLHPSIKALVIHIVFRTPRAKRTGVLGTLLV